MWKNPEESARRPLKNLMFLNLALLFSLGYATSASALTHDGAVVILPLEGRGGISPYGFVSNDVEPALAGQVKVVDSKGYFRELRRQRLPVKKAFTKRVILKVAPKIGAKQALVLESTTIEEGSGRRRRRVALLRAAMIDVEKGASLFVYQWPLPEGKFTARIARDLVRRVVEVLPERAQFQSGGFAAAEGWSADSVSSDAWSSGETRWEEEKPEPGASAEEPFMAPSSPEPSPVAVETSKPTSANREGLEVVDTGSTGTFNVGVSNPYEDMSVPTFEEPTPSRATAPTNPAVAEATPVVSAPIAQLQTAAEVEPPVERPWLRLSLGGGAMQRVGYVPKPTSDGSTPTTYAACFCGPLGEINPMFANVAGVVEVFPFRVGGGDGLAHLGVQADISVGSVTTAQENGESFSSTVLNWDVGMVYEFPLWNEFTAPVLSILAGYSSLTFPLESGPFPGLSYTGPSFAMSGTLPLGAGVVLEGGGGLRVPLAVTSDEAAFSTAVSAWAWTAEVGVSYALDELLGVPLQLGVNAEFMGLSATLTGESVLPGNVVVTEASLVDVYRSVQSTVGFTF